MAWWCHWAFKKPALSYKQDVYLSKMAQEHDLGIKMDELPITTEAKVFYLTNWLKQYDYVKGQHDSGIEHPKIRLDLEYVRQYYQHNELAQRDMDLIIGELREIGVIDEHFVN